MKNWNKFYSGAALDDLLLNRVAPKVKTIIDANPAISSFAGRGRAFSLALGVANVNSMRQLQKNDIFQGQSSIMGNKPKSIQNMLNLQLSGMKNNQRLDTVQDSDSKRVWANIMGQRQSQATKTTLKNGLRTSSLNTSTGLKPLSKKSLVLPGFGGGLGMGNKNPFSFGSKSKRWKNFGIMSDFIGSSSSKKGRKSRKKGGMFDFY
jgi:hypothetical protein